jgi:hypothetical protein
MRSVRMVSVHCFSGGNLCRRAAQVRPARSPAAAVVLFLVLASSIALSGCEYSYDDGRGALPVDTAAPITDAALPRDTRLNLPVSGAELDAWAREVLPDAEGQVFYTDHGTVEEDEEEEMSTGQLPSGTYALTLACRSERRVAFTVRDAEFALVDLSLRCGTSRVNVVHVAKDSVLRITVEARRDANFALRVSRI